MTERGRDTPVVPLIRTLAASLSPRDTRVAAAVLEEPAAVIRMSVSELAERAGTAPSTVVHACRALGFAGFQDLKIRLAQDVGAGGRLTSPPSSLLHSVLHGAARALTDAPATLDEREFDRAVDALAGAHRLVVAGVGTSWAPAQDAAHRFLMLGLPVQAPPDVRGQLLAARLLTADGVLVVLSHTGASAETLEAAEAAREAGGTVVAITSFARTALAARSDVVLVTGGHDVGLRLEAMLSRLTHLAVVDALYLGVAARLGRAAGTALDAAAAVTATHTI